MPRSMMSLIESVPFGRRCFLGMPSLAWTKCHSAIFLSGMPVSLASRLSSSSVMDASIVAGRGRWSPTELPSHRLKIAELGLQGSQAPAIRACGRLGGSGMEGAYRQGRGVRDALGRLGTGLGAGWKGFEPDPAVYVIV